MSKRDNSILLEDIAEAIENIFQYNSNKSYKDFISAKNGSGRGVPQF